MSSLLIIKNSFCTMKSGRTNLFGQVFNQGEPSAVLDHTDVTSQSTWKIEFDILLNPFLI